MSPTISLLDRLRIERVVWSLDQRLYDLPGKSRVAKRREVRANLLSAAQDVGARAAVQNLGSPRVLAGEYREAEFGDQPQPLWLPAAVFLLTGQLFFTEFLREAAQSFAAGVVAADPHATGTFVWSGLGYVQSSVTYTMVKGVSSSVGGAWTPFAWGLWIVGTVCVGRLWRVVTARRGRSANRAPGAPGARSAATR